jgi:AcrR family transcriptional regulator
MTIRATRRELAIEAMADHLLAHGLEAATLRQLAQAAGTSDRMLLYYFNDRDELLSATLERIAARLATKLDALVPPGARRPFVQLLADVRTALASGELMPYMDIWLSLSARSRSHPTPHMAIAGAIADRFLGWTTDRISAASEVARAEEAALLITVLNGLHVLQSIGRAGIADIAQAKLASLENGGTSTT